MSTRLISQYKAWTRGTEGQDLPNETNSHSYFIKYVPFCFFMISIHYHMPGIKLLLLAIGMWNNLSEYVLRMVNGDQMRSSFRFSEVKNNWREIPLFILKSNFSFIEKQPSRFFHRKVIFSNIHDIDIFKFLLILDQGWDAFFHEKFPINIIKDWDSRGVKLPFIDIKFFWQKLIVEFFLAVRNMFV